MAAITSTPPSTCKGAITSPKKTKENTPAMIGSRVEVMLARVARIRLTPSQ